MVDLGYNSPMAGVFHGMENGRALEQKEQTFEIDYDPTVICMFLFKLLNLHELQILDFYN